MSFGFCICPLDPMKPYDKRCPIHGPIDPDVPFCATHEQPAQDCERSALAVCEHGVSTKTLCVECSIAA